MSETEEYISKVDKLDIKEGETYVFYTNAKSFQKADQIREALSPYFKSKKATCFVLQSNEMLKRVQDKTLFERVCKAEKTIGKIKALAIGDFFLKKDSKEYKDWIEIFVKEVDSLIEKYQDSV